MKSVDPRIATMPATELKAYLGWRYGLTRWQLRRVDPERLRTVIGLLTNSGTLYDEEVARWLSRTRVEDIGYARPLALLRHRGDASFQRVVSAAQALVNRMNGLAWYPEDATPGAPPRPKDTA